MNIEELTKEELKEFKELARRYGVKLESTAAENKEELKKTFAFAEKCEEAGNTLSDSYRSLYFDKEEGRAEAEECLEEALKLIGEAKELLN